MTPAPLSYTRILAAIVAWWLLWTTIHAGIVNYIGFDWQLSLADSAVSNALLSLMGFAAVNTLRYYQPGKNAAWNLLLWCALLAGIYAWGDNHLMKWIYEGDARYLGFLHQSLPVRYCIAFLMIGCVLLLSWVWRSIRNSQEEEDHRNYMEKLSKEAELEGLRKQLQPHFLFNSLNSINALVVSRPEEARKMIQQLSDFMRYTLKKGEQQMVSFSEEMEQLQLYLEIEKVRFGHRLRTEIETGTDVLTMNLPVLLLQPIVENAIKSGLYDTIGEITIRIRSKKEDNSLSLSIENPFDPETVASVKGTGFGLSSIQRRLYLLFGRNDLLQTHAEGKTFITSVKIPQSA